MTATITKHVPHPFGRTIKPLGNLAKPEPRFDVSCDACGWQSKETTSKQEAERWRDIHNGAILTRHGWCPI